MDPVSPPAAGHTPPASHTHHLVVVGSPNAGKTTLFNALTGLRARTGNYPGVTVERRVGRLRDAEHEVMVHDLPGTYSLNAISEDERIAVQAMRGELPGEPTPDAVLIVADATTLARSLPMIGQVLALGRPTVLALTMTDEMTARGGELDLEALSRHLGVPVVPVVGHKGAGVDALRERILALDDWAPPTQPPPDGDAETRFRWADTLLRDALKKRPGQSRLTRRIDDVLLHPVLGGLVFLVFVVLFFQAIFSWAGPAMDFCADNLDALADWTLATLPEGLLTSLLADGILRGVGAVVVFVPQIALLFAILLFFESCGYMARAAYVVDRLMSWVGLEGRCFVSLLSSYACAVPGVMATRTIPSPRDRLATILVAPFATCSARLPVYALLIAAVIPGDPLLGPITYQGATLFGLYLLGGFSAVLFAALFRRGMRGAQVPFYLEQPPYRFPSLKTLATQVWERVKLFLTKAGKVILVGSIVLWFLLNFPQVDVPAGLDEAQARAYQLQHSFAADIGRFLEPVFAPLGFDWRIVIGLVGSFAARELMVSTMAQVYAFPGGEEDLDGLAALLRQPDPLTGEPAITFASGLSLMVFFVYALLCVSTIAVVRRETASWKWPLFQLAYMMAVAWLAAFVTYRIAS